MGLTGGVTAEPVMTDVYRITARGNAYTGSSQVQDFALMKAAETTIATGGTHFIILGETDQTNLSTAQTPGTMQTSVYGSTAFTTYTPGMTYNIVKPGQAVMIQVIRLSPGETLPPGACPAMDIVQTIGPRLKAS
jgi:hypothetical protein